MKQSYRVGSSTEGHKYTVAVEKAISGGKFPYFLNKVGGIHRDKDTIIARNGQTRGYKSPKTLSNS